MRWIEDPKNESAPEVATSVRPAERFLTMTRVVHIELEFARAERTDQPHVFEFRAQRYLLLRPQHGGAEFSWTKELLDDLERLRHPFCEATVKHRVGVLLRTFLEEAGWKERVDESRVGDARIIVTIRSAAAELYALPWELLELKGSGLFLADVPGLLLRYEWPQAPAIPDKVAGARRGRVLFAWSAAGGGVPADEHLRALRTALTDRFDSERDVVEHATLDALRDALAAQQRPPIDALHILCHGSASGGTFGLALDDRGDGGFVGADELGHLLARHAHEVRMVVLAVCDGGNVGAFGNLVGSVAQRLHRAGVQIVIASRFPLNAAESVAFTEVFYARLGGGALLVDAFLDARAVLWAGRASIQLYCRASEGDEIRLLAPGALPSAEAMQPPRTMTPTEALHDLLCDLYNGNTAGLRRLLSHDEELKGVVTSLPDEGTPLTLVVDKAGQLLAGRGLVPVLLARLLASEDFRRRRPDIERVAALWPGAAVAATRDDSGSRVTQGPAHEARPGGDPHRGGRDEGAKQRATRPAWDAQAELTPLLINGPLVAAQALQKALCDAPAAHESHRAVAERVAATIDALGEGISAAEALVDGCLRALESVNKEGRPADHAATQKVCRALVSAWMPHRYDADGEGIESLPGVGGCDDYAIKTDSPLMSEFPLARAQDRPAAVDPKRLRGVGSLDPPPVNAEMWSGDQAALQTAQDLAGENPARRRQFRDDDEGSLTFARDSLRSARRRRRPRNLTMTATEWNKLLPQRARAKLKELLPDLCQVELRTPGLREASLVGLLCDLFEDLEDIS